MGILEMDFERILGVAFFLSSSHSIMLWTESIRIHYIHNSPSHLFFILLGKVKAKNLADWLEKVCAWPDSYVK